MPHSEKKTRIARLLWIVVAVVGPWLLASVVVRATLAENDCLEYPGRVGYVVSVLYGAIFGVVVLLRHGRVWKGVMGFLIAALFLAGAWQLLLANLLGAADRGKQKRTMADVRSAAAAVDAFRKAEGRNPADLAEAGVRAIWDAWGLELRYEARDNSYGITSAGACGIFEKAESWGYPEGPTDRYSADIVLVDGRFVAWPEGVQQ